MAKKGGLGKGLDALFADNTMTEEREGAVQLRVSQIEPNREQPRRVFDENTLAELADSIRTHGVIQPLLVRELENGQYQLVAGERRWRAARMAGLSEVPVVVREMEDSQVMEIALVENLQREDLNPVEEAKGYKTLMETYDMTQDEVAGRVGKSRPAVANALRLLALEETVLQLLEQGKLSAGHARAIVALGDRETQKTAAELVVSQGLSVRDTEKLCRKLAETKPKAEKIASERRDTVYDEFEIAMKEVYKRRVRVSEKDGKGTLQIEFYSKDDFLELVEHFMDK